MGSRQRASTADLFCLLGDAGTTFPPIYLSAESRVNMSHRDILYEIWKQSWCNNPIAFCAGKATAGQKVLLCLAHLVPFLLPHVWAWAHSIARSSARSSFSLSDSGQGHGQIHAEEGQCRFQLNSIIR